MNIPIRKLADAPTISLEGDPKLDGKLAFGTMLRRAVDVLDREQAHEMTLRVMEQASSLYGALLILHEYVNVPHADRPIDIIDDLAEGKRILGYGS